jgi:hypothetical protein
LPRSSQRPGESSAFLTQQHDEDEFEAIIDPYEAVLVQPVSRH